MSGSIITGVYACGAKFFSMKFIVCNKSTNSSKYFGYMNGVDAQRALRVVKPFVVLFLVYVSDKCLFQPLI